MSLNSDSLQPLLMMAGLGLMCWMLLRSKLRRKKSGQLPVTIPVLKHNANVKQTHQAFTGTQSLGAPAEVLKWQVELHDLGRELKAELDSKLVAVSAMTRAYDQAAQRLSNLIRLAEQTQAAQTHPLAEARRLSALGWDHTKIASALGLTDHEVQQLLS